MDLIDIDKTIILSESILGEEIKMKKKLPFHLNIIDELRANENAHSRIFNRLLQYQDEKRYPLWELFLKHIELNEINIASPLFLPEKHRIDILIEDKSGKYAFIIENKIHGAIDQSGQIERYINRLTQSGYDLKEIFVLYLTREGGTPNEDSLSEEMKEKLGPRYKEVSYRNDILPWIEETALPSCRFKDTILISALQQYIDHLQGLFRTRKTEQEMNEELIKYIETKLDLNDNLDVNSEKINKVISNLDKTKEYLIALWRIHWFRNIEKKIRDDFRNYPFIHSIDEKADSYSNAGILIEHKSLEFSLLIEAAKSPYPYYGAGTKKTTRNEKDYNVDLFLKELLPEKKKDNSVWYGYTDSSYDNVYNEFKNFADRVIKKIEEL